MALETVSFGVTTPGAGDRVVCAEKGFVAFFFFVVTHRSLFLLLENESKVHTRNEKKECDTSHS